tara:strand:- start:497 stop:844 length:348 start_codon:yes stop_codon:yes gene_type:complete
MHPNWNFIFYFIVLYCSVLIKNSTPSNTMKNLLYILLFAPLALFGQEQDPCYSINDFITQLDIKPPISYQLSVGWNMVGYTGTAENSGIVNQINGALSNDATAETTFQVIKNVSG